MTDVLDRSTATLTPPARRVDSKVTPFAIALVGNPNVGKTCLFNQLTGLRRQVANYPGTTVEHQRGWINLAGQSVELLDLPGFYSLGDATTEERIARQVLQGEWARGTPPSAALVVADACNLERSLFLVRKIQEIGLPILIALNMTDIAQRDGISVDLARLGQELNCRIVPTVARTGEGIGDLKAALADLRRELTAPFTVEASSCDSAACTACAGCPFQSGFEWAESVAARAVSAPRRAGRNLTDRIDRLLTHPVYGLMAFVGVLLVVFYLIFSVATVPMDLIDGLFANAGAFASRVLPDGDLEGMIVDGLIGGVGGILVFLPQICILFFFLALLEDTGYLARGAFVMDRLMQRVGLPGTAFVPLLSSHACAIPGIMAARVIRDPRDRLVTILVAPLMTCSARIPVYAMVTALLFPASPGKAALVFMGAYSLGIVAALTIAALLSRTLLPGRSQPLVLELPEYRLPRMRTLLRYVGERAWVFIQQAGTIILVISLLLWAFSTYPKSDAPAETVAMQAQAEQLAAAGSEAEAAALSQEAARLESQHALSNSLAGRVGRAIEPVFAPLGFDWQIGIGVLCSFAAREVIVSTLAVVYGVGEESVDDNPRGLYDTLRDARRTDGTPVFTMATSLSLLVFYVLAMQCLPTQAVTRRETGGWKWPLFQLGYMTLLAYCAAFITYNAVQFFVG